MIKQFVIGKTYKLVDASLSPDLKSVIDQGLLTFPADGVFLCKFVDTDGDCHSDTHGITWRGIEAAIGGVNLSWMCAEADTLDAGAIVEVTAE